MRGHGVTLVACSLLVAGASSAPFSSASAQEDPAAGSAARYVRQENHLAEVVRDGEAEVQVGSAARVGRGVPFEGQHGIHATRIAKQTDAGTAPARHEGREDHVPRIVHDGRLKAVIGAPTRAGCGFALERDARVRAAAVAKHAAADRTASDRVGERDVTARG